MENIIQEAYCDGLIETTIGVDPGAMYHLLNKTEMKTKADYCGKDVEVMNQKLNEVYMDDLIETAIGIEPQAMYQILKQMESISGSMRSSREPEQIEKAVSNEYLDDLIETSIGIDPQAMYLVIKRMERFEKSMDSSNESDLMKTFNEIYMDNLNETSINVDPLTLYKLKDQKSSMIERSERDRAFSEYVDELIDGIDTQIKESISNKTQNWDDYNNQHSTVGINSKTILDMLNRVEKRLEQTEHKLAELKAAI